MTCGERSTTGVRNTTSAGRTVRLHIEHLLSSAKPWAMEMWKANSASHIPTALTTTARYTRPQHQTEKLQLWLDEKNGAGQWFSHSISAAFNETWYPKPSGRDGCLIQALCWTKPQEAGQ